VNEITPPPLVSIGLPVYNGARFLRRAVDALLAQRSVTFELVISDNASTDDTLLIARTYETQDARVRVLQSPVNLGIDANFASVLAAARGRYFMWAACDDWWDPGFVPRLLAALEGDPSAVVAMSAVERVDESGQVVDVVRYTGAADPARLTPRQLVMQLAGGRPYHLFIYGLYRTDFLRHAFTGFAPVIASDRLFLCRVAMGGRFAYVDEVLHRRTIRTRSIPERYGNEAIGRLWQGAWPRWRLAFLAGPYLWRSPVLPPGRRWWIPAIVLRFFRASLGHSLVQAGWIRRRPLSHSPR
jgi:glycosyltransferase involved in cell wall biosynthesis